MKNSLDFTIPFSPFAFTDFISCFASTYMFLENIDNSDTDAVFFLFDTMCGRSSLRLRFDKKPSEMQKLIGEIEADGYYNGTDSTIDFLFGFAGYEYRKCIDTATFKDEIIASINTGKPVLGKVKSGNGRFRVITGYDSETLISPDYDHAQDKPGSAPSYDELEVLYIIGNKISPRYTFRDGLARIQQVIGQNIKEKIWDDYIEKMGGWIMFSSNDGLEQANLEERISRMNHLTFTMQYAWNCHNFGETFRDCYLKEMKNPAFTEIWGKISDACYCIDAFGHAVNYLNGQIDWSNIHFAVVPGLSATLCMILEKVKKLDMEILELIKQAIMILDNK